MTKAGMAAAMAASLAASTAMATPAPAPARLVLTATHEVQAVPDMASIGAGVVTQAAEAQAALAANSEKMVRVVAALKKAGVAARDIQTSGLNLQPQYRYEQNQPPVLTGFQASNRVQVLLRDVAGAGRVIDTLVKEGANQIDGPDFRVADPQPLLDKARVEAVKTARARAELYAQAAGLRVDRITEIREGAEQRPPMPVVKAMSRAAMAEAPPVEAGEVGLSATVMMEFDLAPR